MTHWNESEDARGAGSLRKGGERVDAPGRRAGQRRGRGGGQFTPLKPLSAFPDQAAALGEIRGVLAPGGRLLVALVNPVIEGSGARFRSAGHRPVDRP